MIRFQYHRYLHYILFLHSSLQLNHLCHRLLFHLQNHLFLQQLKSLKQPTLVLNK